MTRLVHPRLLAAGAANAAAAVSGASTMMRQITSAAGASSPSSFTATRGFVTRGAASGLYGNSTSTGTSGVFAASAALVSTRASLAAATTVTMPAALIAGGSRGVASSCPSLADKANKNTSSSSSSSASSSSSSELQQADGQFDEITDKWIPEKPVSAAEGAGYSVVIAAGLAVALGAMWFSFKELLLEPVEQSVFNAALDKIQIDPRVTVRIGTPMTGYGNDSRSRSARQKIAHSKSVDGRGVEHVRVQFAVRGPQGKATVHADAYKGESGGWEFAYLLVDVNHPSRERVVVVQPQAAPSIMRTSH